MTPAAQFEKDLETRDAAIAATAAAITDLLAFLASDKFTGTDSDGTRKDWVSTKDVTIWLIELRSTLG